MIGERYGCPSFSSLETPSLSKDVQILPLVCDFWFDAKYNAHDSFDMSVGFHTVEARWDIIQEALEFIATGGMIYNV